MHSGGKKDKSKKKKDKKNKRSKKDHEEPLIEEKPNKRAESVKKNDTGASGTIEPYHNPDDVAGANQNTGYRGKREFRSALRDVVDRRLREIRIWMLSNLLIFVVTAPTLHFPRWDNLDFKG